ncbi:MAG: TonB-dependent receptor domain-containing protein, partial [Opitutales bacterium]
KFDDNQLLNGMQMGVFPNWADWHLANAANVTPAIQPGYTSVNGIVTNYTLKNVLPVIEDLVTKWTTKMESVVWNLDLAEKSEWPVHFQSGYSKASRQEEVLEDYAVLGFAGTTATGNPGPTWTIQNNAGPNGIPQIVSTGVDLTDPSLYHSSDQLDWGTGTFANTGQEGYLKYFSERDIADSFKLLTKHDLNMQFFKDVEVGVSYSQRFKWAAQSPTGYLVNSNGQGLAAPPPFNGITNLSWMGSGLNTQAWDSNAWALGSGKLTFISNPNTDYIGDDYSVWENVARPYVQFDLKGQLGNVPYEGNVGVVSNMTSQRSTGYSGGTNNRILSPVSASASYNDFQPTMNLIFKPTTDDLIRLFVGRQEQRPRMYDMRASRNYSFNAQNAGATNLNLSPWGGNAGNPNLKPWTADSVDLDYEHYFAHGNGYFSLALFEKHLNTYIYQSNQVVDFTGYAYTGNVAPVLHQGIVSQFVNGAGGSVSGVEATLQINSELVTGGAVKGFGLVFNGEVVDSTIQPWGPGNGNAPLPDMSKKTANVTLYWERYGFSARVNTHYQSAAREYIVQFGAPSPASAGTPGDGFSMEAPFHTIDAQVSYAFSSGPLKGLGLFLEGRNLNKAPMVTLNNGNPQEVMNWQRYGAFYRLGANYKF